MMAALRSGRFLPGLAMIAALAACQSGSGGSTKGTGKSAALRTMEHIATTAYRCWFASRDPAFRDYRMADELNSFSGRPRFLLVPADAPEARPHLVVQAEGAPARLDAFGPLMDGAVGARIGQDLRRWKDGSKACQAA